MKKKYNVLVFPCGSEIGLEIYNSLKFSSHFNVIGASSMKDHGVYNYSDVVFLPFISELNFLKEINKVINKKKIDFIFPAHDSVVYYLAPPTTSITSRLVGSSFKTVDICRFKSKTYQYFKNFIRVPKVYCNDNVTEFPVFLKPDVGNGSKGAVIANNEEELDFCLKHSSFGELLVLEFLPGKEFTVDCFTDKRGNLLFAEGRERIRIINGISVNTSNNNQFKPEIEVIAKIINSKLKFRGAWFFQLKLNNDNNLSLLEIAPRIAGSMALFRNYGINFSLLSLFDLLEYELKLDIQDFHLELDRSLSNKFITDLEYKNVYVDLDDCLIINNKINTQLIKFLFQCLNEQIKIYLITRHRNTLNNTIKKYKIENLFDNILLISDGSPKSGYIKEKNSIFIDDSFTERKEVHSNKGIPVFAPDAIECLLK